MFIVWRGRGIVSLLLAFPALLLWGNWHGSPHKGVEHDTFYMIAAYLVVAAIINWLLASWWGQPKTVSVVDKAGVSHDVEVKPNHSVFALPMKAWSIIGLGVAAISAYFGVEGQSNLITEIKPPAQRAESLVFNSGQLLYCRAESARLQAEGDRAKAVLATANDSLRKSITSQYQSDTSDFGTYCSNYKYKPSDETAVLQQVRVFASELRAEGVSRIDHAGSNTP